MALVLAKWKYPPSTCEVVVLNLSSYCTKDNKITCDNYKIALDILKEKLYNGDYYTSTNSSVYIAYNRRIHRFQVSSCQDCEISMNENVRSRDYYDNMRLLEIPTASDDFDKYLESEIQLAILNDRLRNYDQEKNNEMNDDVGQLRKTLIDSIIYIQDCKVAAKEAAAFEFDNGNSELARRCINMILEKQKEQDQTRMDLENVQHTLSSIREMQGYDLPNDLHIELANLILRKIISSCTSLDI